LDKDGPPLSALSAYPLPSSPATWRFKKNLPRFLSGIVKISQGLPNTRIGRKSEKIHVGIIGLAGNLLK